MSAQNSMSIFVLTFIAPLKFMVSCPLLLIDIILSICTRFQHSVGYVVGLSLDIIT